MKLTEKIKRFFSSTRFQEEEKSLIDGLQSSVSQVKDKSVLEDLYTHFNGLASQFDARKGRFDAKLNATIGIVTFLISSIVAYILYLLDKKLITLQPVVILFSFAAILFVFVFVYLILLLKPESGFAEPHDLEVINNAVGMNHVDYRRKQIILLAFISSRNLFLLENMERKLKVMFYVLLFALLGALPSAIISGALLDDKPPGYIKNPVKVELQKAGP